MSASLTSNTASSQVFDLSQWDPCSQKSFLGKVERRVEEQGSQFPEELKGKNTYSHEMGVSSSMYIHMGCLANAPLART